MIDGDGVIPYEFYFSPLGHDARIDLDANSSFLREFIQCIRESGLEKTVGLRLFPHLNFTGALEITEGRANINLTPDQVTYSNFQLTVLFSLLEQPILMKFLQKHRSQKTPGTTPQKPCGFLNPNTSRRNINAVASHTRATCIFITRERYQSISLPQRTGQILQGKLYRPERRWLSFFFEAQLLKPWSLMSAFWLCLLLLVRLYIFTPM